MVKSDDLEEGELEEIRAGEREVKGENTDAGRILRRRFRQYFLICSETYDSHMPRINL